MKLTRKMLAITNKNWAFGAELDNYEAYELLKELHEYVVWSEDFHRINFAKRMVEGYSEAFDKGQYIVVVDVARRIIEAEIEIKEVARKDYNSLYELANTVNARLNKGRCFVESGCLYINLSTSIPEKFDDAIERAAFVASFVKDYEESALVLRELGILENIFAQEHLAF